MLSNQKIGYEYQEKKNGKWVTTSSKELENEYQACDIYKSIAQAMIDKKICKCTYIKSIKRVQLYNGYIKIYITYSSNFRAIYVIKD